METKVERIGGGEREMTGKFNIKVDKSITEQLLIENCIMYKLSGLEYIPLFVFYALAESWHIDKLIYYKDLLEKVE